MKTNNNKYNWHTNKSASAGVLATKLSVVEIKSLTEQLIRQQTLKACEKSQPLKLNSIKNDSFINKLVKGTKNSSQNKTFVDAERNI